MSKKEKAAAVRSKGMIFAFEGIDASGKKTQSQLLQKWLLSRGIPAEFDSFPDYSTVSGREIRAFLLEGKNNYPLEARHMLFALNRLEHKEQLEKWLREGKTVVINRYCSSNLAYGSANGLPIEWLKELEKNMPEADYVFYLKADSELSKKRKASDRDRFEVDLSFLDRVTAVYDALAESANWF